MAEPQKNNFEETAQTPELSESAKARYAELREKRFMYRHFIDGILSGEFKPMPPEGVREIIEQHYFSFEPLMPLDERQEALLKEYIAENLSWTLNRDTFKNLAEKVYIGKGVDWRGGEEIIVAKKICVI